MGRQGRERSGSASIWSLLNIFKISGGKRFNTKGVLNHEPTKGKLPVPPRRSRVVYHDEDAGFWGAAEPDIDQKATDYIARFYQHRA